MMPSDRTANSPVKLWQLRLEGSGVECVASPAREGVEMQILINGNLLSSYRFDRTDELLACAADRRRRMEARGWRVA